MLIVDIFNHSTCWIIQWLFVQINDMPVLLQCYHCLAIGLMDILLVLLAIHGVDHYWISDQILM